jgi:chromosome segregation ATPase
MSVSLNALLAKFNESPNGTFMELLKKVQDTLDEIGVPINFNYVYIDHLRKLSKSDFSDLLQYYYDKYVVGLNETHVYYSWLDANLITMQQAKDILDKLKTIKDDAKKHEHIIERFGKYIAEQQKIEDLKQYEDLKAKCAKLETEFEEYKAKNSKIEVELSVAVKDMEAKMAEKDGYIKEMEDLVFDVSRCNYKLRIRDFPNVKGLSKKELLALIIKEYESHVDEILQLRSEREDQTKTIADLNVQIQELTAYKDQLSGIQNAYKNLTAKF